MTARRGAYARRVSSVTPAAQATDTRYEGPHWTLYVDTSEGQWCFRYGMDEPRARAECARHEWLAWRAEPLVWNNIMVMAGLLRDDRGRDIERWGDRPVDPLRPRWRHLTRCRDWMQCPGCQRVLWPFCITASVVRQPAAGADNDAACRLCLIEREVADPRPSWGSEPFVPHRRQWPKWVIKLVGPEGNIVSTEAAAC